MNRDARSPEELETLLEDAFVVRDAPAVSRLFLAGGVLAVGGRREARGAEQIARAAAAMWRAGLTHVAEPRRVVQARDTALVLADGGIGVARRARDGSWRYAIALLTDTPTREDER